MCSTKVRIPFRAELERQMHDRKIDKLLEYIEIFARKMGAQRPSYRDEYGVFCIVALPRDFYHALRFICSRAHEINDMQGARILNELLRRTKIQEQVQKAIYDLEKDDVPITSNSLERKMGISTRTARRWLVCFKKKGWMTIYTRTAQGNIYVPFPDFGICRIGIDMAKLANETEEWLEKHDIIETFRRNYAKSEFTLVIRTVPIISIEGFPQSLFS